MSDAGALRASVIVLNYNGARFLPACLDSVTAQELAGGYEILVVDNGSTDDSLGILATGYPAVRVIEAGRNLGFAAGNNLGIRAAQGGHVVLLNNDTVVQPGWLAALVEAADADPTTGAVSSKLVAAERPGMIQSAGSLLLSDGSGADRGSGEPDAGQYERLEEVFGLNGAGALLCRRALDEVGVLDEAFFMYYEDTDLSWRMRLRSWKVIYQPAAVVWHRHAASSQEWSPFFTFHVDRNRLLMLLKNARWGLVVRSVYSLLGLVVKRGVGGSRASPGSSDRRSVRGLGHYLKVLASLFAHLPGTLVQRHRIRGRRKVGDAEIESWMQPRKLWDARSG